MAKNSKTPRLTIALPPDLHARLQAAAARHKVPPAALVRAWIAHRLDQDAGLLHVDPLPPGVRLSVRIRHAPDPRQPSS